MAVTTTSNASSSKTKAKKSSKAKKAEERIAQLQSELAKANKTDGNGDTSEQTTEDADSSKAAAIAQLTARQEKLLSEKSGELQAVAMSSVAKQAAEQTVQELQDRVALGSQANKQQMPSTQANTLSQPVNSTSDVMKAKDAELSSIKETLRVLQN